MRIKRFNENNLIDRRYKVDIQKVYQKYKRRKNVESMLTSIIYMIDEGKGTIYLYSLTDNGNAYIKSNSYAHTLHVIPVEALIDFDMKEWELQKDTKKYNL